MEHQAQILAGTSDTDYCWNTVLPGTDLSWNTILPDTDPNGNTIPGRLFPCEPVNFVHRKWTVSQEILQNISKVLTNFTYFYHFVDEKTLEFLQRGCCCIMSLWLRNFCTSSYSIRTLHSWSKKFPALGIHVIVAYTECQQCPCITFDNMNILLSAIFIFYGTPGMWLL